MKKALHILNDPNAPQDLKRKIRDKGIDKVEFSESEPDDDDSAISIDGVPDQDLKYLLNSKKADEIRERRSIRRNAKATRLINSSAMTSVKEQLSALSS